MASLLGVLLLSFRFMLIFSSLCVAAGDEMGGRMEEDELVGLFEVMGSLLDDQDWAQIHPHPCTETPWPGVECEVEVEDEGAESPLFHVTKIHVGSDVLTPPCKSSATLSSSLVTLLYLKTLSIFNCFQTHPVSLPPSLFSSFSSLQHVSLVSNPALVGLIPPSLAQVTGLKVLNLGQNNLQGLIPKEIGKLVNLEQLDLSYNNLTGSIPEELGDLKSLTILDLCWNRLKGTIPYSTGQLQQLQKMDLSSNNLVDTIPPEIGQLSTLVLLDLSHNSISGPIPETFTGLKDLQYLLISNNPINSGIPYFIKSLKKLTTLSFSACGLKGHIPTYFPELKNLTSLSLDNNSLNGTVPSNLGTLPYLNHLNLSFNQLQGELLLPQHFVNRLGFRLDVKGNTGLCTSLQTGSQANISTNFQTPPCSSVSNKTWISESPQSHGQMVNPTWSAQSGSPRVKLVIIQFLIFVISYMF
ncbi:hypothetical protein QQ045_024206 [Rhodiola kirilowii]